MDEHQRYIRDEVLGEGTYGKVYKGTDSTTGEVIALKKTLLDLEQEGVPASTLREVVLLKELQHPNIVALKDVVITQTNLFLIFEYLDLDLRRCIMENPGMFTQDVIKSFMYQMVKAVSTCHSRRILHRDLKPANILVNASTG
jgi:serine/threonine protein kinase